MIISRELLDDILSGNCLPFIGAGFSKYADLPDGKSMPTWDELASELGKGLGISSFDNSEIAQKYADKFGRRKLIQEIERILLTHIAKAGDVHREFAKIAEFKILFTTNFDNLLEQAYKEVGTPVKPLTGPHQVVMLASPPTVNIIKMHGDLESPEYLVVTKKDYDEYMKKYETIVTQLAHYLETKTPLFLGYSLSDPNFQQIKQTIENAAKEFAPKGYIVLLNPDENAIKKFEGINLNVISLTSPTKTPSQMMLEFFKEISLYKSLSEIPNGIDVKPKKTRVNIGGSLVIHTSVKPISSDPIDLKIQNPNGEILYQTKIPVEGIEQFTTLTVGGEKWKEDTHYQILAEYNGKVSRSGVYVSKPLPIVLQSDKSVYLYGKKILATIVNPNVIRNLPINLEILRPDGKLVYKNAIPVTDDGNGIFQEEILIGGKDWTREPNSVYKMIAEYAGQSAELTFYLSHFGATINLDQKVYTWTDKVYITIVAPEANSDPNVKDIIGDEWSGKITISTKNHKIPYRLEETGPNTGIFTGYVILTGDPSIKGQKGVDGNGTNPNGTTGGNGPTDGFIACANDDSITVTYEYVRGSEIQGSALIRWNIGTVRWLKSSHSIGEQAVIQVVDPDMNLDPQSIDKFDLKVWSTSDSDGITISVQETGKSTGIFQGIVNLTAETSSENKLKVKDGDKIHVQYIDRTLPSPYTSSNELILKATAFVGKIIPPLGRLSLTEPVIVDKNNNRLHKILTGDLLFVGAKVTNLQKYSQSFVFMMQIKDQSGTVVHLSYMPYSIWMEHSIKPLLPWRPETAGEFEVQMFAWESIDEPTPMARTIRFTIIVEVSQESKEEIRVSSTTEIRRSLNHNVIISPGSSKPDNPQFFVPEMFSVKKGDKVSWLNEDVVGHTVTSGRPSDTQTGIVFDSSLIPPSKGYTRTFSEEGTFYYFCQIHPWEIGIINVD